MGRTGGSESFYYGGKNCQHPKGQTRLVIPTASTLAACETCNSGPNFIHGVPHGIPLSFV
jgi:hypothetical protein